VAFRVMRIFEALVPANEEGHEGRAHSFQKK
jgi:hypothetical protein